MFAIYSIYSGVLNMERSIQIKCIFPLSFGNRNSMKHKTTEEQEPEPSACLTVHLQMPSVCWTTSHLMKHINHWLQQRTLSNSNHNSIKLMS